MKNDIPNDNILVFSVDTDFLTLDPALVDDYIGLIICQSLFEPLLILDHKTGEIIPGAAKHYKISDNEKTYIFYLDENNKWSNGETVTAFDFEFAFKRIIAAKENSGVSSLILDILNSNQIINNKVNVNELGVKAIETHNATIKKDINKEINNILIDILPIFPLFSFNSIYLKKPYIKNFKIFPCGHFSFRDLDIEKNLATDISR
jgi:ABC-type transport system substrate-binding protein